MSDDIKPTTIGDCSREDCPSYDGKRCRLTGFTPRGCEPGWGELLDRCVALEEQLRAEKERADRAETECVYDGELPVDQWRYDDVISQRDRAEEQLRAVSQALDEAARYLDSASRWMDDAGVHEFAEEHRKAALRTRRVAREIAALAPSGADAKKENGHG